MNVLYIEDDISCFLSTVKHLPEISFDWLPSISHAITLINSGAKEYDLVISDYMGVATALRPFEQIIKELKHDNIVITSSRVVPMVDMEFVPKKELIEYLKEKLK